jgi:hypothetical protein
MRVAKVGCSGGEAGKAILISCMGGEFFFAILYLVATQPQRTLITATMRVVVVNAVR